MLPKLITKFPVLPVAPIVKTKVPVFGKLTLVAPLLEVFTTSSSPIVVAAKVEMFIVPPVVTPPPKLLPSNIKISFV